LHNQFDERQFEFEKLLLPPRPLQALEHYLHQKVEIRQGGLFEAPEQCDEPFNQGMASDEEGDPVGIVADNVVKEEEEIFEGAHVSVVQQVGDGLGEGLGGGG